MKEAVIIITANRGDVRAARGVWARSLKKAGIKASYVSSQEMGNGAFSEPRYRFTTTREKLDEVLALAHDEALATGFAGAPGESYMD